MASKILAVLALAAVCNAKTTYYTKPHTHEVYISPHFEASTEYHGNAHKAHHHDDNKPVEYHFKYEVHDPETNDHHSQEEKRIGDHVKGHYKLVDADGYLRTVHYTADDHNGFVAEVQREPHHCPKKLASEKAARKYEGQKHQEYAHHAGKPEVYHHHY